MNLIAHAFPKLRSAKEVVGKMSKKPRFRTSFESQHAKRSQKLLKSTRQHFYQIFLSLREKWSWTISLSVISEILRLFVNKFVNKKLFLNLLLHFWNLHQILNISKKMMILVAHLSPKLRTAKGVVRYMSKKNRLRLRSTVNILKVPKHRWNQHSSTLIKGK